MPNTFNIDNHEVIEFTNKLEKLHRSAMPVAVRQTLNDVAFIAKNEVNKTFAGQFTERKKKFITSHTAVNKSINTFNIKQMSSSMGVIKGKSDAGDELQVHERGGTLKDRSAIATKDVRVGKSETKLVSKRFYLKNMKGKGVIYNDNKRRIFASNNTVIENVKGQKRFNVLYRFRDNRKYESNPFIAPAGKLAAAKLPSIFAANAKKRIEKELK